MAVLPYIRINGQKYDLDPDPEVESAAEIPQKYLQAADDGDFWQTWEMRSFQSGERRTRILAKDQVEEMTYDDGEHVDISTWGELKLQPALTRSLTVSLSSLPMVASNDGAYIVVGRAGYISRYNASAGTWALITAPDSGAITDIITGIGQNMYAIQTTKIIESTDDGATWANNTSTGVPTDMVGLTFCANELYALGPTYLKYWDGSAWQSASTWGGDFVCTYNEQVYFIDAGVLYRYNGTTAYEADRLPAGFAASGLYAYGGVLFIPGYWNVQGGKKGSVFYIMEGRRAHLYNVGSTDGSSNYTIAAVAGSDDEVWVANQKRGGVDRFDTSRTGGVSCGPAWGSKGVIPFKGVAYANGRLLVARYDGVGGTDGVYEANVAIPTAYETSGWLTTAEFDWFLPHDYKLFSKIVVEHKALAAAQTVKVEYSLDGGTTYVLAGFSDTIGTTSKTLSITNARARSLKLRLTLNGPGTSTPTVTYVRVDAGPLGEATSLWDYNLAAFSALQGRQRVLELKKAYKLREVVVHTDVYGSVSNCVFEYLKIRPQLGDKWTVRVFMRLREV